MLFCNSKWFYIQGSNIGLCAADPRVVYAADLIYPVWVISMPNFIREEHRELFLEIEQVLLIDYL